MLHFIQLIVATGTEYAPSSRTHPALQSIHYTLGFLPTWSFLPSFHCLFYIFFCNCMFMAQYSRVSTEYSSEDMSRVNNTLKKFLFISLPWVLVAAHGLTTLPHHPPTASHCSPVCGILIPWPGIEPTSPALEGRVSATGLPGKSPSYFLRK